MEKPKYLDFLNPIHIIWRQGTTDDPYVDKTEILPVVNQRIVLSEIPDKVKRVKIHPLKEINYDEYKKKFLQEDEFYVDYTNGIVFFNKIKESDTMTVSYKGKGFILYPSSRIYHHDKNTDVVSSLKDITQQAMDKIEEIDKENQDLSHLKDELYKALEDNNATADQLRKVLEKAISTIELVNDAYQTTQMVHKPYVAAYEDLQNEYPYPKVGWTAQVAKSGIRYRWDGSDWIPIDILGGSIPNANKNIDGLMSKEDYIKLNKITSNVETRAIVFIIPDKIFTGIQNPHISFPFDGEILGITSSVAKTGDGDVNVDIEKSTNYIDWTKITSSPITIKSQNHFDDTKYNLSDKTVKSGDVFRLNISKSSDIENLTLNIKINLQKGVI